REVMTTIDRRLFDLDKMGIDIQVVAPAPGQCYYSIDPKIAEAAHRLANEGVVEYCSRKSDRFVGLGVVTLQEPDVAVRELDYAWGTRQDAHCELPLPPTTYLRQVYLDTVVFTYHQLAYLIDVFGPDRIVMGTDYPFDMAEYNPIGHIAGVHGMDDATLAQI